MTAPLSPSLHGMHLRAFCGTKTRNQCTAMLLRCRASIYHASLSGVQPVASYASRLSPAVEAIHGETSAHA